MKIARRHRSWVILVGPWLTCGLSLFSSNLNAQAESACFNPLERASFPILQNAPPPRVAGQANYAYNPVTIAATAQVASLNQPRPSGVKGAFWQWANHGPRARDGGAKGNITPGSYGVQIRFSSNAAANNCTLAQTARVLGLPHQDFIAAGALTPTEASQSSDTQDICVLPTQTVPAGDAVLLDYEVQDGRTAADTLDFLTTWSTLVHRTGRKTILYTNPVDAPSQRLTQVSANAPQIANLFDLVSVNLWSGNRQGSVAESFRSQAELYRTSPEKLMVVFELAKTTVADAATVFDIMRSGRAGTLAFWRNYAVQGGSCSSDTNQKISCAAFGRCR